MLRTSSCQYDPFKGHAYPKRGDQNVVRFRNPLPPRSLFRGRHSIRWCARAQGRSGQHRGKTNDDQYREILEHGPVYPNDKISKRGDVFLPRCWIGLLGCISLYHPCISCTFSTRDNFLIPVSRRKASDKLGKVSA